VTRPTLAEIESLDLNTFVAVAERVSAEHADGPLTLMRFTTGWKCMLGTPNLDGDGRSEVSALPPFGSLREALIALICGSGSRA
jgi:hypothetical protein